jgi:nitroreductase
MDALQAILSRRSVRQYAQQPVPSDAVTQALRAAMAAPSAGNEQAWQFVVLTDRSLLDRMAEIHPYAQMIRQAPVAVIVCGDLKREVHAGYWVQDCAAATENLLLALHAQGLGAVWTGVYPREDRVAAIRAALDLPEHIVPMALIPIGVPAENPGPIDRYDASRVHTNGWS